MTPAPHPLRCETCKNDKCLNFYGSLLDDVQNGYLENLCGEDKAVVRTISIIGCASHSASSDVLEDFMNKIVSSRFELDGEIVVRITDVRIIREELRQQTKEQRG
jgi:hypothetical protein